MTITHPPSTVKRITCTAGSLSGERVASLAQKVGDGGHRGVAIRGVGDGANESCADDDAVGDLADGRCLLGRGDPETDRDRDARLSLRGRDQLGEL